MGFWPSDIFAADAQSPRSIMEDAGKELSSGTKILAVSILENRLTDRVVLAFVVKNESYPLELNLFEAVHQLSRTYPVVIDPPNSDIPEFLVRKRKVRGKLGFADISAAMSMSIIGSGTPDTIIENEWVCATPQEFRDKLKKVFSLDFVKSNIISLLAPAAIAEVPTDKSETQQVQGLEAKEDAELDEASEDGSQ